MMQPPASVATAQAGSLAVQGERPAKKSRQRHTSGVWHIHTDIGPLVCWFKFTNNEQPSGASAGAQHGLIAAGMPPQLPQKAPQKQRCHIAKSPL